MSDDDVHQLVGSFFRNESGRLISLLARSIGLQNIEIVEDAVQDALVQSLDSWKLTGPPQDPSAWLYRVARNKALDAIRRRNTAERLAPNVVQRQEHGQADIADGQMAVDEEIRDSFLRMILTCSHEKLAPEVRLSLTLKMVCGFSRDEISRALLSSTETTKKRIYRGKQQFASGQIPFEIPLGERLRNRLESVHTVVYLMFNEGHSSSREYSLVRHDLCEEAVRLCKLLVESSVCRPQTRALLALMLFHVARFETRVDEDGCLLRMEEQDRDRWDGDIMSDAFHYLAQSADGEQVSRYHLEAGIAAQHCLAPSFKDTDWRTILMHYDLLLEQHQSPVVQLNRGIVVAHLEGPEAGVHAIESISGVKLLKNYYLLDATLGELYRRIGNHEASRKHLLAAQRNTTSSAERMLIEKTLQRLKS